MTQAVAIEASALKDMPDVRHGFFTRQGGLSQGLYASLNGGLGSGDDRPSVIENRRRMTQTLGVPGHALASCYQVHSADVIVTDAAFADGERPKADAMVTSTPGLALGIATADCGPVLFADAQARVIGAAHAGWQGAFKGILENTIAAMENLGASRSRMTVVLGPTIGAASYEVGPEFVARFCDGSADNAAYFTPSDKSGHAYFDLPAYIMMRLTQAQVANPVNLALDTYADEQRFYSYRRTTHRKEADYGRLISAIALV
ncbi:MAG: peptidoglycan editing factor PgeF [Beijerinckiaceae bacterium]